MQPGAVQVRFDRMIEGDGHEKRHIRYPLGELNGNSHLPSPII